MHTVVKQAGVFLVAAILLGLMSPVQAAVSKQEIADLQKKLTDVKLYKSMLAAKVLIDSERAGRCGEWIKKAGRYRQALEALDVEYRGRYDRIYQKKFRDLTEFHRTADERYRKCFARNLFESRMYGDVEADEFYHIKARKIFSYAVFKDVLAAYDQQFRGIDLAARIGDLEIAILAASSTADPFFARITAVRGTVEVLRHGQLGRGWEPARRGQSLGAQDTIRTGKAGGAEIMLSSVPVNIGGTFIGSGQARVYVGGSTKIRVGRKAAPVGREKPARGFLTDVVHGSIRAISKRVRLNVGSGGRGGAGGIRGTEASFSYDPAQNIFEASLAHGDAFVASGGREITLRPATTMRIRNGRIGTAKPLSRVHWNRIVAQTGLGTQTRESAAKFGTGVRRNVVAQAGRPAGVPIRSRARPTNASGPNSQLQKAMRGYARSVAATVVSALHANDTSVFLANTTGSLNAAYRKKFKTQPPKSTIDMSRARPESIFFRCTHCDPKAGTCQVLIDVQQQKSQGGRKDSMLVHLGGTRRNPALRANQALVATPARLKAFDALNPVCRGN